MTTDMGRDMAGDMARELGTVFWGDPCAPDPSQSSLFGENWHEPVRVAQALGDRR
jgi:hypothetical protein